MHGTASRLALSGLFLSIFIAAPAAAQSRSAGAAGCYRTIADRIGADRIGADRISADRIGADRIDEAAASRPEAGSECSAPRERVINGGVLEHAIMLVADPAQRSSGQPTPTAAWRAARPAFAVPPAYR